MNTITSKDGTSIAFERHGEGTPLILVDGATAHRALNPLGAQLGDLLGASHTVYTYDRRGRGDSGDTAPYSVEREIEDLAALIAEAGGTAHVCGFSSGAVLALDAAAAGLPITRLAAYEPPFVVDGTRPAVPEDYLDRLDASLAGGRRGEALELFFTIPGGIPVEFVAGMKADPMWAALEAVAPTLAYDGRVMAGTMSGRPLPRDRWSALSVPTLVIYGGASDPWMANGARAISGLLPTAGLRELPGQTHSVSGEVLAPALAAFLAD
ncbi:alpha/beta hydrolase [Microtetraspora sp. NBRC 13810]|uniref:alpha/beta fold hydrolase n=1 Tax=Microtetraspora sp. NBRC 13810 TaxID=3030990 RepID=UPI002552CFF2|nr:alpha/beta hydrolase [Microtetraspora sp. NBRC 13810]GLW08989.1 alpha/beta hydrolase [Microtetraspora sp. NBRC 13810]